MREPRRRAPIRHHRIFALSRHLGKRPTVVRPRHRVGAPLPIDPNARIHILREEIAAAAAEVRRVRKWWRDPSGSGQRIFLGSCAGVASFLATAFLGGGGLLSLVAGTAACAAWIGGPGLAARWLAHADLRSLRRTLRGELHRLPREEQYRVLRHYNHHPDPDTNRIVSPLMDELRSAFPEITPTAAPDGRGDEASPPDQPDATRPD